jgi:hypothetical protein
MGQCLEGHPSNSFGWAFQGLGPAIKRRVPVTQASRFSPRNHT